MSSQINKGKKKILKMDKEYEILIHKKWLISLWYISNFPSNQMQIKKLFPFQIYIILKD